MTFGFEVLNGPQFRATIAKRAKQLSRDIQVINAKVARDLQTDAKRNTPVRTGDLRDGWQMIPVSQWEYWVTNDVEYGPYVEFGTSKMAGRFMLTRAIVRVAPQRRAALEMAMKRAVS